MKIEEFRVKVADEMEKAKTNDAGHYEATPEMWKIIIGALKGEKRCFYV